MKSIAVTLCMFVLFATSAANDEMPVAELVKKHLDSIGTEQARAAVKTRVVQGVVRFRVLSGGRSVNMLWASIPEGTDQVGKEILVSEGNKLVSLLKLPIATYHGERFVSDGKKNLVAQMRPGTFSDLGEFVHVHDEVLTEGLWGGVFSTGWALAHLEDHHAILKYKGLKKIDGRELYWVEYVPAKHSDLEIALYFDPQTFHHILTTYSLTVNPHIAATETLTARQQPSRYVLEEQFVAFKAADDLQLPGRWIVRYTENVANNLNLPSPSAMCAGGSGPKGSRGVNCTVIGGPQPDTKPFAMEFDAVETSISHNVTLDPNNFEIK